MKIHLSAKICRHTKGGYLAQQLIHKTKSGYTDPGHYIYSVLNLMSRGGGGVVSQAHPVFVWSFFRLYG